MSRRAAIVLLIGFMALAGRPVCSRAVPSCLVLGEAAHDCCGKRTALRATNCCCKGARSVSQVANSADMRNQFQALAAAVGFSTVLPDGDRAQRAHASRAGAKGLSPPDTPVSRHNTLLL